MPYRPGPFEAPHKALRNALSQFQLQAGRTDYSASDEIRGLQAAGDELFRLMDSHLVAEDERELRLLEERAPGGAAQDLAEHRALEVLQGQVRSTLQGLDAAQGAAAGNAFYLAFSDFHGRYLRHIHHEETATQALILEHVDPDELQQVVFGLGRDAPHDEMMLWFKFGMPAFPLAMRLALLGRLERVAPPGAIARFLDSLRGQLPDPEIDKLRAALEGE